MPNPNAPTFAQFYGGIQQKKAEKWAAERSDLVNLREDLPEGISRIRPFPAITQNPVDAFLTLFYHPKLITRTPEELKLNPNRGVLKSIICEDGLNGKIGGTDCLVCRLILFVMNNEGYSSYMDKVSAHYFTRTTYFGAVIVPEIPVATPALGKFVDPAAASSPEPEKPKAVIASISNENLIEQIHAWLGFLHQKYDSNNVPLPLPPGTPGLLMKEDTPEADAQQKADFVALMHPQTGRCLEFTRTVKATKSGSRTYLNVAMGNRVVPIEKELLENAPDLEKFKKLTKPTDVQAALLSLYPRELLKAANVIG